MREPDWKTLLWSLQRGNCILLLGPELFDEDADDTPNLSLTQQLSRRLSADLSDPTKQFADLPAAAQQYAFEKTRGVLERETVDFYGEHENDDSDIHDKLAEVPFYLTITSCHDKLFDAALAKKGKPPRSRRYNFRGVNEDVVSLGTADEPLVYHLYGWAEEPESLVLTENDLLDFLVAVISKKPSLPNDLRSELQDRNKSFLFVGFGMRHWYLRILLHVLKFNQLEQSFALEALRRAPDTLQQTIGFYRTGYRLEIFQCAIRDFVNELHQRSVVSAPARPAATATAARNAMALPTAPRIFISHASEDNATARRLSAALAANGADTWLDTIDLEVGAPWDPTIEKHIQDSDYFVVIQSEALRRKDFSYVNKEIYLAKERQKSARVGVKFILPVRIDDSVLIDDLASYQAVPVQNDEEIAAFVSVIKRDFQRRAAGRVA